VIDMAKKDDTTLALVILLLGLLAAITLFFFPGILGQGGCTICGSTWASAGRMTSIPTGGSVNIGAVIANYNSIILSAGRTLQDADQYAGCQFPVYKVIRYKQISDGVYWNEIYATSSDGYLTKAGTSSSSGEGFYYNCPGNYQVVLDPAPKNCILSTNPDPTSYTEYSTCDGLASMEVYIKNSAVISTECSVGQTKTCANDNTIVSQTCVNNLWKSTGVKCPSCKVGETTTCSNDHTIIMKNCVSGAWQSTGATCPPGGTMPPQNGTYCTNTCATGYTRTAAPDCKCLAPNQNTTTVCSPNSVLTATCPDGNVITTFSCINGGWSPVENCTSTGGTGDGTIMPPPQPDNTTLFIILFAIVFLVAVIGVVGFAYLFAGRRR
jgi:hypothetical protein